jgi:carbonic anhydrase
MRGRYEEDLMKSRKQFNACLYLCVYVPVSIIFLLGAIHAHALSPAEAITKLKEGNSRYAAGKAIRPNQTQARQKETAEGQHPFVSVLSCSDSRVPLELIFDQGIGDIFVVRVAGNVIDTNEIGSLEYGVRHLATPLIVVLGHTHCGAVAAAVKDATVQGSLVPLIEKIKPAADKVRIHNPKLSGDDLMERATEENVLQSIRDLILRSPIIREQLKDRTLQVVGAMYDIETGRINWLGPHPELAQLLEAQKGPWPDFDY